VNEAARMDVRERLNLLIAAARNVGNRAQEALDALDEGHSSDGYRAIYNASDLAPELAAVREAFRSAGVIPNL
jgi:hypothetical protein